MNVEELVKEAVLRLLECELAEENGWSEEDISLLEKVRDEEFDVVFKNTVNS